MEAALGRNFWRVFAFAVFATIVLVTIIVRLTQIQIFSGSIYEAAAKANQRRLIEDVAPRGYILDRNGKVLVRSRPSFVAALIPSQIKDIDTTLDRVSVAIGVPKATLFDRLLHHHGVNYKNLEEVQTYEPNGPVILASDLKTPQMARLFELQSALPGVDVLAQPVRNYPFHTVGSHMFGTVGQITKDEYAARRNRGYTQNDIIGKEGLEATYDQWLKGVPGGKRIEVNAQGVLTRELGYLEPKRGNTLVLDVDWKLQVVAEKALAAELKSWGKLQGRRLAGAVVVEDPNTGGILAMASQPNFDPNDFSTGVSPKNYAKYIFDTLRPLYNRAIAAQSPTGSTFKMVTASGALTAGVVKADDVVYDSGAWYCHGVTFRDIAAGGFGNITISQAIASSSDGFFYQMADRLGHVRLRHYAREFGLAHRTGVDIPGEQDGNWPTNEWMMKVYNLPLEPSDVCQLGIGQGAYQATPVQMANAVSAVANGGTLYRPHIAQKVVDPQGHVLKNFERQVMHRVGVQKAALAVVRLGMSRVTAAHGTAYGLAIEGVPFGGKTGTVETDGGHGPNTTWFVAFAPVVHPKIAIAVYMERTGGYGANVAAPVAQQIIAAYFHKKIPPI